ncbi:MAG: phage baseplate assembly protein V [Myxococcota bacterium]
MDGSSRDSCGAQPPNAMGTGPRHFGKYRGTVIDNIDPTQQARLLCIVPAFSGMKLSWALPCVPYAGPEVGFFAIPPIGANVWVEFEGGNLDFPIWSGCFWEKGELPPEVELSPEDPALVKVWKTPFCTLMLNDTPAEGGITLSVIDAAVEVPITMTFTSAGVEINTGVTTLTMNAETGTNLLVAESTVTLTEAEMSVETPDVNITANVNVTGPVEIEGNVDITGAVEITGNTEIGGALEVEGETNLLAETTCEGDVNIAGACTVEGAVELAGALAVEGESNFLGLVTIEGDQNILGGGQVEGNFAVLGVIEGVVVPPLL